MMSLEFIDPKTKMPLDRDADGNYYVDGEEKNKYYACIDGCCDFVKVKEYVKEVRGVYDQVYSNYREMDLSEPTLHKIWHDPAIPWFKTVLESMGSLEGKKILLIGNGDSYNEFYFLLKGATVVYTDLSIEAAMGAKRIFSQTEIYSNYSDKIEFHAVDGTKMPFPDQTFDIIFGKKCVGFIDDQDAFFSEISRCLKENGICRFLDDAHSPAWEKVRSMWRPIKAKILWRFMSDWSRVRSGGTPYGTFGIKKEVLMPFKSKYNFAEIVYIRNYFFLRIAQFAWVKFFGWGPKKFFFVRPIMYLMKWVDQKLISTKWMERNSLPLILGFNK